MSHLPEHGRILRRALGALTDLDRVRGEVAAVLDDAASSLRLEAIERDAFARALIAAAKDIHKP
jgi:hypothetical protein